MVLNALDEVLFWDNIELLKDFIRRITEKYYPHDPEGFYREKEVFMRKHVPDKKAFADRLEYYAMEGAPIWVSGRNQLSDDIDRETMVKAISVSSKEENGRRKAERAVRMMESGAEFWRFYSDNILFSEENCILELTVGAGLGTNAVMRGMKKRDYYMGVDLDFVCAKNADAIAKYYGVNGLGIAASLWSLPFDDGMFSSVCSNSGLEECREIPVILGEAVRVLAPGGRLVLHCIHRERSIWYSTFAEYGFSPEETVNWLKRVRLFADADQVEETASVLGLRLIGKKTDERLGHILVFEK